MTNLTTYEYDVFLSHNRADQDWTSKIAERLEREDWQGRKLRVFFSPWDIRPGQSIPKEIERALPKSRKVGLVLSPDAMKSAWVELERLVTTYIDVSARDDRLIPLLRGDCEIPGLLKPILHIDFRNDSEFEQGYQTLLSVIKDEPLQRGVASQKDPNLIVPAVIPRPPIVGFVARSDRDGHNLIELLKSELAPSKAQLVTLWGAGGVGKTTLAAEAARALADDFSQRVVWVSADGRSDLPFPTFLDDIATQLGDEELRKLPPERKSEAVRTVIAAAPTLVVLDNFETISSGERQQCLEFLTERAHCSALITTRQRLEHARSVPITGMTPIEADHFVHLLVQQTQDPGIFAIAYRTRLIETAESNPLIMEWIVGQIDLANDPEEVLNDLTHGEGDAAHRVFDRSYNLPQLNEGGRAVLLALSLFTPSAGRPTLAAVAGMDLSKARDKKRFKKAQETLASLWLIKKVEAGQRLAVAGLTRELTKAHLAVDSRAKAFLQRFVARFLQFTEGHKEPTRQDYNALELEKDNVITAANIALTQQDWWSVQRLAFVIAAPEKILEVRGYWEEAIRVNELGISAARLAGSDGAVAAWLHNLAASHQRLGNQAEARRLYDQCLELRGKIGDQDEIGPTLFGLAGLAQEAGDYDKARELYEQSLEVRTRLDDKRGIAITLGGLGWLAQEQGNLKEARRLHIESLRVFTSTGDQTRSSEALHHLGLVAQEEDALEEARALYTQSLEISTAIGDQKGIASTLHQLGQLDLVERNYQSAEGRLQQSSDILRKLGDTKNLAECLETIARLRVEQGHFMSAEPLFVEALRIAEVFGLQFRVGSVKQSLAELAERENDKVKATQLMREALAIFEKLGSPRSDVTRRELMRLEKHTS